MTRPEACEVLATECIVRRTRDVPERGGACTGDRFWFDTEDVDPAAEVLVLNAVHVLEEGRPGLLRHRRNLAWISLPELAGGHGDVAVPSKDVAA